MNAYTLDWKTEYWCFPYLTSLCKSNRARWLLVTIITTMMIPNKMIVTLPNAAAAPAIAPAMLLSGGDVLSEGGVVLSEDVTNTIGK